MRLLQEGKNVRCDRKTDQFNMGSFTSKEELNKWLRDTLKKKQDIFGGYNYTYPVYFSPLDAHRYNLYDISVVITSTDVYDKDDRWIQKDYKGKTLTLNIALKEKGDSPDSDDWDYAYSYEYFDIPMEKYSNISQYTDKLADELVSTTEWIVKEEFNSRRPE